MPNPRRIVWAPRAKQDLNDIWRHYAHVASPEIADRLLREIDDAAERAGSRPLAWRRRDEIAAGLRSVLAQPYAVFYRLLDEDGVQIVRVLHQRRNLDAAFPEKRDG